MGIILSYAYKINRSNIRIAYYDKLTGLPNSEYLQEYLEEGIRKNKKAVMLLNCTNLKTLNLTYGYQYGDQIIKQIANNIKDILESEDMLFRFNADRFVMIVEDYADAKKLEILANRVVDIFKKPFNGGTKHEFINAQIAIVEMKC